MSTVWFLSLFVVLGSVGGISVVLGGRSELLDETTDRRLQSLRKELLGARNYANDAKDEAGKSRSLTDLLEALDEETELTQKKSNTDEKAVKDDSNDDDDDDDNDDDGDEIDGSDVSDGIFYFAANLADEIKATCDIDIAAIFSGYSPATLTAANDANTKLGAATKDLSDVLTANPGFAKDLKAFADSSTFKASDVSANLDKTFANIEKTLSSVRDKLFCAEAQLIATRLQMSLYGGVGFANGYLCNKVFVELIRYDLNATRLLEASTDEEDFVRNCTRNLVDDITCYEKELEAYNKIIPTAAYTAASPLQTAAFTADFLVGYGVVLMYHRVILLVEADIVKLCAECKDQKEKEIQNEEEEEEDKEEVETLDEDTESLTNQLQKLLRKLNEVSAKKKEAQKSLSGGTGFHANDKESAADGRSGVREPVQSENEDLEAAMPSTGEKTAIKKSYYREREN